MLSAVEGVRVVAPGLGHLVVPVAGVIITALFAAQRFGTGKVGALFGPVMLLWFGALAAAGVRGIVAEPGVLKGLSPTYAVSFVFGQKYLNAVTANRREYRKRFFKLMTPIFLKSDAGVVSDRSVDVLYPQNRRATFETCSRCHGGLHHFLLRETWSPIILQ